MSREAAYSTAHADFLWISQQMLYNGLRCCRLTLLGIQKPKEVGVHARDAH